jgi:type IV secretion system protein TrbL
MSGMEPAVIAAMAPELLATSAAAAAPEALAATAMAAAPEALSAAALTSAEAAPLFGSGLAGGMGGGGMASAFGPTAAQSGLLGMGQGATTMGGIAAEMGAPLSSGVSSIGGFGLGDATAYGMAKPLTMGDKLGMLAARMPGKEAMMMNGMKMAGQGLLGGQQQQMPHAMPSMQTGGDYRSLVPQPGSDYRKRRDELLKRMLGMQ